MSDVKEIEEVKVLYCTSSDLKKKAISNLLDNHSFLLSSNDSFVVITGVNVERAMDLSISLLLSLEKEFGIAFTRSLIVALSSRISKNERKILGNSILNS